MMLIYSLTRDLARAENIDKRVRVYRNTRTMRGEQILTERGICYLANSYLSPNLSAK